MTSDLYTVHVESDVAGMVVRSSGAALESSLPTMALHNNGDTYMAVSEEVSFYDTFRFVLAAVQCHQRGDVVQGKVHMIAATEPAGYAAGRCVNWSCVHTICNLIDNPC